jgi:predicted protein tyrosine phosphatase
MMLTPFWRFAGPACRSGGRPNLSLIVPNLLVGEYPTPDDAEWLRDEHGVTVVVNLQDDADLASKGLDIEELQLVYRQHGLGFHRVALPDGDMEILAARLDALVDFLARLVRDGECVYLHCNAGFNRAPTVAIAYLHVHRELPLSAARDLVKERRHCLPYMTVLEARYVVSGE